MDTKEIIELKKQLEELSKAMTEETFKNATEEQKKKYIELMTEIKLKLEILNSL